MPPSDEECSVHCVTLDAHFTPFMLSRHFLPSSAAYYFIYTEFDNFDSTLFSIQNSNTEWTLRRDTHLKSS